MKRRDTEDETLPPDNELSRATDPEDPALLLPGDSDAEERVMEVGTELPDELDEDEGPVLAIEVEPLTDEERRAVLDGLIREALEQIYKRQAEAAAAGDEQQSTHQRDLSPLDYHDADAEPRPAEPERSRTRRWLVFAAIWVVLGPFLYKGLEPPAVRALPDEVLGEWRTTAPTYANRFLWLYKNRITIGLGENGSTVEMPIENVRRKTKGDTALFEVAYSESGELTKLAFKFVDGPAATLHLPNPVDVVWMRRRR